MTKAAAKRAEQAVEFRQAREAVEQLASTTGKLLRLDASLSMGGYRVYEVVIAGVVRPIPVGRRLPFGRRRYPTLGEFLASLKPG